MSRCPKRSNLMDANWQSVDSQFWCMHANSSVFLYFWTSLIKDLVWNIVFEDYLIVLESISVWIASIEMIAKISKEFKIIGRQSEIQLRPEKNFKFLIQVNALRPPLSNQLTSIHNVFATTVFCNKSSNSQFKNCFHQTSNFSNWFVEDIYYFKVQRPAIY